MNSKYLEELAALNALGALDGDDVTEFKRLAPNVDEETKREIASFEKVAALIATAGVLHKTPPALVKERLMKRVHESLAPEMTKEGPGVPGAQKKGFSFVYAHEGEWMKHPVEGIMVKQLSLDDKKGYATLLMRVAAGTKYPEHNHTGPEECYVLAGSIRVGEHVLRAGDFHHAEPGTHHGEIMSDDGALLLLVVAAEDYLS
ncbi:MAG: cupin domain-containing protein [Bacteroidota bacterium]